MRKKNEYISDIHESMLQLGVGVMMMYLRIHAEPERVNGFSQNVMDEYLYLASEINAQHFKDIEIAFNGLIRVLKENTANEDARGASRGGVKPPSGINSRNVGSDVRRFLSVEDGNSYT